MDMSKGSTIGACAGILFATAVFMPSLSAQTTTGSFAPSADTWLFWNQATQNFATSDTLAICANNQRIALIAFPISSIPTGSVISSAVLTLSMVGQVDTTSFDIQTYLGLTPFVESQATYSQASNGVPWGAPGLLAGTDYCNSASCTGTRLSDMPTSKTIDVSSLVTTALAAKSQTVTLVLFYSAATYGGIEVGSRRNAVSSMWPNLTVQYDATSPVARTTPSPVTLTTIAPITLDGSSSSRPSGGSIGLTFNWTVTAAPSASALTPGQQLGATSKVSAKVDVPGDYSFQLTVSDPVTQESSIASFAATVYNVGAHPRLGLTPALLTTLRQLQAAGDPKWTAFASWLAAKKQGWTGYTYIGSDGVGFALAYAIANDQNAFTLAWQYYEKIIYSTGVPPGIKPFFGTCPAASYCDDHSAAYSGGPQAAEVAQFFDWCYGALSPAQRSDIIQWLNQAVSYNTQTNSMAHAHFRSDGAAIAYELAAVGFGTLGDNLNAPSILQLFHSSWAEQLQALDVMGTGGALAEGNGYGEVTANSLINTANMTLSASGEDLFLSHPWFKQRLMYDAFATYPKRLGGADDPLQPGITPWVEGSVAGGDDQRGRSFHSLLMRPNGLPLARRFEGSEEASAWEWVFRQPDADVGSDPWYELVYYYPLKPIQKPTRLSFYDPSMGYVYVRSDWNSEDATSITSWAGPHLDMHQHLDQGGFTISKRRDLAATTGNYDGDSGTYSHSFSYYTRTVSSNGLLIGDPQEIFGDFNGDIGCDANNHSTFPNVDGSAQLCPANDGGQRTMSPQPLTILAVADYTASAALYNTAKVVGFADTGTVVSWVSDISNAYSNPANFMPGSRPKVSSVFRKFVYLRSLDILLVGDSVTSTDPTFEKRWLLHSVDQMLVGGTVQTIDGGESVHTNTDTATIVVGSGAPTNTGQITPDYRSGYAALNIKVVDPKNATLRVVGGRAASVPAHPAQGQSNTSVLQDGHLHTHSKDFWVKDYSAGYQSDHASANWAPVNPPEITWTIDLPSMIGGYGNWTLNVEPSTQEEADFFLTIMQATVDPQGKMPSVTSTETASTISVTVGQGSGSYNVEFAKWDTTSPTVALSP
jgi:hypothetical protein